MRLCSRPCSREGAQCRGRSMGTIKPHRTSRELALPRCQLSALRGVCASRSVVEAEQYLIQNG